MLSGVHQRLLHGGSYAKSMQHRSCLHEIRPSADDVKNMHHYILLRFGFSAPSVETVAAETRSDRASLPAPGTRKAALTTIAPPG